MGVSHKLDGADLRLLNQRYDDLQGPLLKVMRWRVTRVRRRSTSDTAPRSSQQRQHGQRAPTSGRDTRPLESPNISRRQPRPSAIGTTMVAASFDACIAPRASILLQAVQRGDYDCLTRLLDSINRWVVRGVHARPTAFDNVFIDQIMGRGESIVLYTVAQYMHTLFLMILALCCEIVCPVCFAHENVQRVKIYQKVRNGNVEIVRGLCISIAGQLSSSFQCVSSASTSWITCVGLVYDILRSRDQCAVVFVDC